MHTPYIQTWIHMNTWENKNDPRSNSDTIKIHKGILEDNYLCKYTQIKYLKYKETVCFI